MKTKLLTKVFSLLNNFLLLPFVIMTFIVKAQPTNNPVHDYYPDSYERRYFFNFDSNLLRI